MKALSIVIVSYNVLPFLEQTLYATFKAIESIDAEVFVVDNNSSDGSAEMVREQFPQAILIANTQNTGFSVANNQAIRLAQGKYVLLLNPDTLVAEDTFSQSLAFMESHPNTGGLGIKMIDGGGNYLPESKRGLPTPIVAFFKIFGFTTFFPKSKVFARYYLGHLPSNETNEIEILSGAFMLMRKEALDKAGLLDETFFMYGEDIDLSYRLIKAGYQNQYFAGSTIVHYKGESTKRGSLNYVRVFYQAMVIFAQKHFSSSYAGLLQSVIQFAIYLRAALAIVSRITKQLFPAFLDSAFIFGGMYILKVYWENNHKGVPDYYPPDFMQLVVPSYIATWLVSVYYAGGYDKPVKPVTIVQGLVIGTFIIAGVTNFLDDYRFSKALILLGSVWAIGTMFIWRLLLHFIRYKNFNLGAKPGFRYAIAGNSSEVKRVKQLIASNELHASYIGFISEEGEAQNEADCLGSIAQLPDFLKHYQLSELVICANGYTNKQAIDCIRIASRYQIRIRTVVPGSNYVIGSQSKSSNGDVYSAAREYKIFRPESRRIKRLADFLIAIIVLPLSPLLMWLTARPFKLPIHSVEVLFGRKSWVGLNPKAQIKHKNQRAGLLYPDDLFPNTNLPTLERINKLYASDYNVTADIELILKAFRQLGKR